MRALPLPFRLSALMVAPLALAACATTMPTPVLPRYAAVDVPMVRETDPVGTVNADAADDPAIWRNPADPARSWIIGTDKKAGRARQKAAWLKSRDE